MKNADNPLTALTGIVVIKLTGTSDCIITSQKQYKSVAIRKIAYAVGNNWQAYEMHVTAHRMKHLLVKSTCGVDQCVNPNHLTAKEREAKIWS